MQTHASCLKLMPDNRLASMLRAGHHGVPGVALFLNGRAGLCAGGAVIPEGAAAGRLPGVAAAEGEGNGRDLRRLQLL